MAEVQGNEKQGSAEQPTATVEALRSQVAGLEAELAEARQTVTHLERRQRIDALLAESEAIDLDAARLLTERTVAEMDEPDVAMAVADLKAHKPYLFRRRVSEAAGAMAPRSDDAEPPTANELAERATSSGDRRDLLRYLRLRRRKT